MSDVALSAYLNDHLAGSVMVIEMVERAIKENEGNPLSRRLEEILQEIKADQSVLQDLIGRMGSAENPVKKVGAWLAEKAGRIKLGGTHEPGLARLEVLEALTMGIHGKHALSRALQAVAAKHPALRDIDLGLLERRSVDQHARVEQWRLEAAREVL